MKHTSNLEPYEHQFLALIAKALKQHQLEKENSKKEAKSA